MSHRVVLAVCGSVCAALVALPGCSAGAPRPPAATPTATASPSSPVTSSTVTSPAAAGTPSAASPRAGSLTVTISGLPSHPALAVGRAPLHFTVTVRNATARTYRDITPLVSVGHCTGNNSPAAPPPDGYGAYAGPRARSDQLEFPGASYGLAAMSGRQLAVDVPEVGLDGIDGDVHLAGDLGGVQHA